MSNLLAVAHLLAPSCSALSQRQLAEYESGVNTTQPQELSIHQTLDHLTRSCNEMELAANLEGTRSAMWKQSVHGMQPRV
jgi:hypothetical protein